jgi:hypothetical protein
MTKEKAATAPIAKTRAKLSFAGAKLSFARNGSAWNVRPTGDYGKDCNTGHRLALEYLAFEEKDNGAHGGHLQGIVASMPRKLTGVEIGFLTLISLAAGAGAHRARQINDYWECCAKEAG